MSKLSVTEYLDLRPNFLFQLRKQSGMAINLRVDSSEPGGVLNTERGRSQNLYEMRGEQYLDTKCLQVKFKAEVVWLSI